MAGILESNPANSPNWRKHKNGCPFYRERWFSESDIAAGEPLYQVFCMKGTPPLTLEEQNRCLRSKTCCWRLAEKQEAVRKKAARGEG